MKFMKDARFTLHKRVLTYFALFAIIPIVLVSIIFHFVARNSAEESAIKFSNLIITRISSEIEDILYDSVNVSQLINEEPFIQQKLRKPLSREMAEKFSDDLAIDSRLNYIAAYNENIFGIYLIAENGGQYKSNYTTIKDIDLRETFWYKAVMETGGPVWFGTHYQSFATETSGKSMISQGFPVVDKATGNTVGVIVVDIEESKFSELINRQIGSEGIVFIVDKNDQVITHPDRSFIDHEIVIASPTEITLKEYDTKYYITDGEEEAIQVYKVLEVNGWKVVASLPTDNLTEDIKVIEQIMFITFGILILLALLVAWQLAGNLVDPITKMGKLMVKVEEGNLDVIMDNDTDDEIGDLSRSFNRMIQRIKQLMETVYNEQKEIRKAELSALQSQINPHFLYNTLATIIWMARSNQNEEIIKIVTAITKFYRIGISRGKDIISVEEEIEHVRNYLIILHHRYSDKFLYTIDIPEYLNKYLALKLILQPIVENAVYHGIKGKREKGFVTISVEEKEEDLDFMVHDTGVGMSAERLEALSNAINNFSGTHLESYGLRNVNERIKIFFGPNYGLFIDSEEGVGTTVHVKLPKILEGGAHA